MPFIYKTFKGRTDAINGLIRSFDPAREMLGEPLSPTEVVEHDDESIGCSDNEGNDFGVFKDDSDRTWTAWVQPVRNDDAVSLLKGGWIQEAE